jgi:putative oxidoreductase
MSLFQPITNRQANVALTVLRVVAGATFIAHGAQKLFVFGLAGVSGGFAQMGIPAPEVMGPFIALLEFFGGIALVFGLLTRLAAVGLAFDMIGAILFVHLKNGFFLPQGFEFALALLAMSAALVFTGAGDFSLDGLIGRRKGLVPTTALPLPSSERARARHAA